MYDRICPMQQLMEFCVTQDLFLFFSNLINTTINFPQSYLFIEYRILWVKVDGKCDILKLVEILITAKLTSESKPILLGIKVIQEKAQLNSVILKINRQLYLWKGLLVENSQLIRLSTAVSLKEKLIPSLFYPHGENDLVASTKRFVNIALANQNCWC